MIDDELKNALRRQDPPPGFAGRVLARAALHDSATRRPVARDSWWKLFTHPVLRWAAAATIGASLVAGGVHYRNVQRERAEGRAAKERLMLAVRIAGTKLHVARTKVQQIGSDQSENKQERE